MRTEYQKEFGRTGTHSLVLKKAGQLEVRPSPASDIMPNLSLQVKRYEDTKGPALPSPQKEIEPLVSRLSRPLKVIESGTVRSTTYDFLSVIHSHCEPMSYRFQDKRRHKCRKMPNFLIQPVFNAPLMGLRSEFCNAVWVQKNSNDDPIVVKSLMISHNLLTQYRLTDGRTDRQKFHINIARHNADA